MSRIVLDRLHKQFEEIYNGLPWLDESYAKKLNYLSEDQTFKRPIPEVHSVAEILSHLTEWRKELLSRMEGKETVDMRMDSLINWLPLDTLKQKGWATIQEEYAATQEQVYTLLTTEEDDFLERMFTIEDKSDTFGDYLEGLLHHDIYHLGQIGIILKLLK